MSNNPAVFLIAAGVVLVGAGLLWYLVPGLGRLPGDIRIEKENSSFYFPITTCILLSIAFSLVMWIARRFG